LPPAAGMPARSSRSQVSFRRSRFRPQARARRSCSFMERTIRPYRLSLRGSPPRSSERPASRSSWTSSAERDTRSPALAHRKPCLS
jgi:hypothetical protein